MKRLFFFWIMCPLDVLADLAGQFHIPREFEACTFGLNVPGPSSQHGPLGFNQLLWADKSIRHFKSMREQAEAARAK